MNIPDFQEGIISKENMKLISDQAHVAYLKINKSSYYDIEDLISYGMEVYFHAVKRWNPDKSQFSTFLINCLKNDFYKRVRDTYSQKRGGLGTQHNKETDYIPATYFSLDNTDTFDNPFRDALVAQNENDSDYDILCAQILKSLPSYLKPLFVQMTNPDKELLTLAHEKSIGHNKRCIVDEKLIANYLGCSLGCVRKNKQEIQSLLAKHSGYNYKRNTK